jgi:hypothetical protein
MSLVTLGPAPKVNESEAKLEGKLSLEPFEQIDFVQRRAPPSPA